MCTAVSSDAGAIGSVRSAYFWNTGVMCDASTMQSPDAPFLGTFHRGELTSELVTEFEPCRAGPIDGLGGDELVAVLE
jgi:hypothetical protein